MKNVILVATAFLLMNFSCNKSASLLVENKSAKVIAFLISKQYPDLTIPDMEGDVVGVPIGKNTYYDFNEDNWSAIFNQIPSDTMTIFVFSGDTLAKYSWQQIRAGNKIEKRYDLSQADLSRMHYTVVYP